MSNLPGRDTAVYGLHRIIQIDGFISAMRTVVEVEGHSIINGTNGAGKSSTLKLLSFFYGGDPSRLDSHAAGRDPFVQFYLPRQSSLLIFEYAREGGLCCVVAYRHKSGTKHVYRFLDGGFTEQRFSQTNAAGKPSYCKGHDLRMHWRQLGLNCSQQIEVVTDYRAIIQNDSSLINRLADSRTLRSLARRYGLGSHKTHMRYIDRICAAIISRSGNMERMKDMLADIMVEDGVVFPESPNHPRDALLAAEIESLREFENEIPRMKGVLKQHYERLEVDQKLFSYASQVLHQEEKLNEDIGKSEKLIQQSQEQISNLQVAWESHYAKLNKQVIVTRNECTSIEEKIIQIEAQYNEYENLNMEEKSADLDNLGSFLEDRKVTEERYLALNEGVTLEENALNRQLSDEHKRFERKRSAVQKKLDAERIVLREHEHDYADRRKSIDDHEHEELEAAREQSDPERENLREARARLRAQAESGGQTEEERTDLAIIQVDIEKLDRKIATARQRVEEKKTALQLARTSQDEANEKLKYAKDRLSSENDSLDDIHKLTFAEEGTWLNKLREGGSDWTGRLGKVVEPSLLQRKDLHAEQASEEAETVFGWSLDLNAIATPLHAESAEQLLVEYATQEEVVRHAKDGVDKCVANFQKVNRSCKLADKDYQDERRGLGGLWSQKENLQNYLKERNQSINEALAQRRGEARKKAERLGKEIDKFELTLRKRLESIRTRYADGRSELLGAWATEESRIESGIARLVKNLQGIKETHESRLKEINEDFNKACGEKGIDSETLRNARADRDAASEKVSEVEASAGEVGKYATWLKTEWRNREAVVASLAKFRKLHNGAVDESKDKEREFERKKNKTGAVAQEARKHLHELKEQLAKINALQPRFTVYLKNPQVTSDPCSSGLLVQEIEALLDSREALAEKLIKAIQRINTMVDQSGETQISQAWALAKDSHRQELGFDDPYDRDFLLELPQALEIFIDEEVKSIKSARIETLRGVGKGLTDFFEKLRVIHGRINEQSRKITAAIAENMNIDALSAMDLKLTSRIGELDYWKSLQEFSKLWRDWREAGESELPGQPFLNEMSSLISALQSMNSGRYLRDYFDLEIHMVENGHPRVIHNDNQLDTSTSDGLKYLALCVIFIAISRLLCPDREVKLHWPIDELGLLHGENIARLFDMLNRGGIVMVGGFPSEDPVMLRNFKHRQLIDFKRGIRVIDIPRSSLGERAIARRNVEAGSEQING